MRNGLFLIGGSSLRIRNWLFLIRKSKTQMRNKPFLIRESALQIRNWLWYCAGTRGSFAEAVTSLGLRTTRE